MQGGYYRVDLTPKVSVLSLNTLMFNTNLLGQNADPNTENQLNWLESALNSSEPDHRFILTFHIYAGSQIWKNSNGLVWNQWNANYTSRYAKIIRDNHEKIILEVAGHDHIGDLRFSNQVYAPAEEKNGANFSFHNIIIAPAVTPNSLSQPGYTIFKLDDQTMTTKDLKMVFFPIE